MASNNFGAYVRLKVDNSEAAKQRFQKEIENLAAGTTPEIDINIKKLTIQKIDTSAAVAQLKKDLEAMLSTISVNNLGAILKAPQDTGKGFDNARKSASAYMQELKTLQGVIDSTYKKQISGKSALTDPAQIDAVRNKYLELGTVIGQMTSGAVADTNEHRAALSQLVAEWNRITGATNSANTAQEKSANSTKAKLTSILALQKQVMQYMKKNPLAALDSNYGKQLSGILDALAKSSDMTTEELERLKTHFMEIQITAYRAGKTGKSFIGTLGAMYKKFGGLNLIHRSLSIIVQQFRQMISCVVELDTAMTELKKVTDETDAEYDKFLNNAITRAKELGAAVTDVVTASADFARLGYELDDASILADAAIVYKNVGDGIEDISAASESIISTMRAFGIEAAQAMTIVDRFNEIGNNFPISSKGIGDALTRSAAALAAAGNDLNESIALITAANSVVQDPDKVGKVLPNNTVMY